MLLADVVDVSGAVATTPARGRKTELLADLLRRLPPGEAEVVVPWLSGELRQRRTGIGWAALRDAPPPAAEPTLSVTDVDEVFARAADLAGAGSQAARRAAVHALFARATAPEQQFLRGLVAGELRQGALEAVLVDALARATGTPITAVRRAVMLCGATTPVAVALLTEGRAALGTFALRVGRPVQPMLAATATSTDAALDRLGVAAVEWKLDGIRVQVHRDGDDVAVFTRSLDDITDRVPELVAAARTLPAQPFVLDGEAIALRPDGRPRPFQETGARAATRAGGEPVPLSWFVFDVLHADGQDVLDLPGRERWAVLSGSVPAPFRVPRLVTADPAEARTFFDATVAAGHEGVVVKSLESAYEAGRRGSGWLKVKPVHTLDLVVLGAEWGHGRRRGLLSNLHLGARAADGCGFVMLGKTFKGLSDELLRWQTERLAALAVERPTWGVVVRPELVVEVAFDGVQVSPRYPGGVTLRFARVVRYRDDKSAAEADTLDAVRAFLP